MADILKNGVRRFRNELLRIEVIPITEDQKSSDLRRAEIQQIIARLHIASHKRGRPRFEKDELFYAA